MRLNWIRIASVGAAALLCAAMFGCATAEAPGVKMSGMSASFDEPDGAVLWFELRIVNNDAVDLPLAEARYSVLVGGETVFRGVRSCEATAPARGEAVVRLPASMPNSDNIKPGDRVTIRGRLTYLTPSRLSEVLFDADIIRPEKGFTATATIPVLAGD